MGESAYWAVAPFSAQGSQSSHCPGADGRAWDGGEREWAEQRCPYLKQGCSSLKAHVGHRDPLAAGQVGIAGADAGEGGEGKDPGGQRWVWGVGPVHLVRVAECPSSGQGVHDLGGREAVSRGRRALGRVPWCPRPRLEPTLGILQGFGDSVSWKEGTSWLGSSRSRWHEALSRP